MSAAFPVNANRFDYYKNFKFLISWDQTVVAGVSKISPLKRTTEVVSHREGGDPSSPRHSPGSSKSEAITLERGISFLREFEDWAGMVHNLDGDAAISLLGYKKNIRISLLDLRGVPVRAWAVKNCWPSEYTAIGELDAQGNAVAFETLVLQNEGFKREDITVPPET